jgi:ATP-citrate lyase beta-subunit
LARKKLSEFRGKTLLMEVLREPYEGVEVLSTDPDWRKILKALDESKAYVVKVDQAVKGRFKKGLVKLHVQASNVEKEVDGLFSKGYESLLVEPEVTHIPQEERYMSLTYDRGGTFISYNRHGGVDVEQHKADMQVVRIDPKASLRAVSKQTGFTDAQLKSLLELYERGYMTLLEINPYVVRQDDTISPLDIAIEVDDAGAYFTDTWSKEDIRTAGAHKLSESERAVSRLDETSPASLKLESMNPEGSIFLLLSGGGASVVVADEVFGHGYGRQLGDYGEYSGNPSAEETCAYTTHVLELLLASHAKQKVLFIGGAVANFTDIAATFKGVIQAIEGFAPQLRKQHVKVYVRRGGPHQEKGLQLMKEALEGEGLLGAVHDPRMTIPEAVKEMLQEFAA